MEDDYTIEYDGFSDHYYLVLDPTGEPLKHPKLDMDDAQVLADHLTCPEGEYSIVQEEGQFVLTSPMGHALVRSHTAEELSGLLLLLNRSQT